MKKRIYLLVSILSILAICSSCTGNYSDADNVTPKVEETIQANDLIPGNEEQQYQSISQGFVQPIVLNSYDELADFIIESRNYVKGSIFNKGVNFKHSIEDIENAISVFETDKITKYYQPSWIPQNADLDEIVISNWSISIFWLLPDVPDYLPTDDLSDLVIFEWSRSSDGDEQLSYRIDIQGLLPFEGNENIFYKDLGSSSDLDTPIMRQFVWVQDGYCFTYSIPLWALSELSEPMNIQTFRNGESSTFKFENDEKLFSTINNSAIEIIIE